MDLGPIVIIVVIVMLTPIGFLVSTTAVAAIVGYLLGDNAERDNAGSELLDTNY